jgi:hypothetical protein
MGTISLGWPHTSIFLILTSLVARITDVSHQCPGQWGHLKVKILIQPGLVAHTCTPSMPKAKAGGLQVQGHPGLKEKKKSS